MKTINTLIKWTLGIAIVIIPLSLLISNCNGEDVIITTPTTITQTPAALKWSKDTNFFLLQSGHNLDKIAKSVSIKLKRNKGLNGEYSESVYKFYKKNPHVYWAVYDITGDSLIDCSNFADSNLYGASVPKVCVASASLSLSSEFMTPKDYSDIIRLLVVSDNNVWARVQSLCGNKGTVNKWAKGMDYRMLPEMGGGNLVNAIDMAKFWRDVLRNEFIGAEAIYKITSSCATSALRSRACMPSDVWIGGKTGTYGVSCHDCCFIQDGDKFYSICVLTELGEKGNVAIRHIFRGLWNEYCAQLN